MTTLVRCGANASRVVPVLSKQWLNSSTQLLNPAQTQHVAHKLMPGMVISLTRLTDGKTIPMVPAPLSKLPQEPGSGSLLTHSDLYLPDSYSFSVPEPVFQDEGVSIPPSMPAPRKQQPQTSTPQGLMGGHIHHPHMNDLEKKRRRQEWLREVRRKTDLSALADRLRHDLPAFFEEGHKFDIYQENMLFHEERSGIKLHSRTMYKHCTNIFRQSIRTCSPSKPIFEVMAIEKDEHNNTIRVRWKIIFTDPIRRNYGSLHNWDAISRFHMNAATGLIDAHRISYVQEAKDPQVDLAKACGWC
eukprot:Clim_evm39s150 gene=Clim_evmTU39s150